LTKFITLSSFSWSAVAARSKAWVYGRSHAGIVCSNPAGSMDVSILWMLCVVW